MNNKAICPICNHCPVSVHITRIFNGKPKTISICNICWVIHKSISENCTDIMFNTSKLSDLHIKNDEIEKMIQSGQLPRGLKPRGLSREAQRKS